MTASSSSWPWESSSPVTTPYCGSSPAVNRAMRTRRAYRGVVRLPRVVAARNAEVLLERPGPRPPQLFGERSADVPQVPRLGGVAGDRGGPRLVAPDESPPPRVVRQPPPGSGPGEARVEVAARVGRRDQVDGKPGLVLAVPRPGREPVGLRLATHGSRRGVDVELVAVGAE